MSRYDSQFIGQLLVVPPAIIIKGYPPTYDTTLSNIAQGQVKK